MGYEEGELELEEGEAAFGRGTGYGYRYGGGGAVEVVDPDMLTYITVVGHAPDFEDRAKFVSSDIKLQYLLGCFQKKFEGEISAENLGSQYGSYGSFLPTYPHSPLALSRSRRPAVPPLHARDSRSPYVQMENAQNNHFVKTALDSSRRNAHYQISNENNDNPDQQILSRSVNDPEQKTPKLFIKVNSNRSLVRNTADVYIGLGLDISPSSSVEGSLDGSPGAPMPDFLPDESPSTIFQIMTCYSIPGGLLLSPLAENVLKLGAENALELRQKPKIAMEKYEAPDLPDDKAKLYREGPCTTSATPNNSDHMAKEKSDAEKGNISDFKRSKRRLQNPQVVSKGVKPHLSNISDDTNSIMLPRTIKTEHSVESAIFETSDQLKETKNDALKGHTIDKNKENKKEPSLDHVFLGKIKYDPDEYNSRPVTSSSHLQNVPNESTSLDRDEKKVYGKSEQCQYKSKEMGSLSSAKSVDIGTENVDQNSSGMIKANKKASSQAAPPRRKIRVKVHKQLNDDTTRKSYGGDGNRALDHRIDLANACLKDKKLMPKIETIASEKTANKSCDGNGIEYKINASLMDKSDHMASARRTENAESSTAPISQAPVVINEQWVCCDKCEKWRLLPYGMNPDILPQKWQCNLLNWLPGMNSCKISEDDTTKALRALYMVPVSENNILESCHDNAASGIGTATAQTFEGTIQSTSTLMKLKGCHGANMANNLDLNDMSNPSKKLHAHSTNHSDDIDCFPKLKEKRKHIESSRKGDSIAKDQTPATRSTVGPSHDNMRTSKKIKKELNLPATQHSTDFVIGKNRPPVNETPENLHKYMGISPGMGKYDSSSSVKHYLVEEKYFSDEATKTLGTRKSDVPDLSTKKSKQRLLSQCDPDLLPSNTTAKCVAKAKHNANVVKELKFSKADRTVSHSRGSVTEVDDVNVYAEKVCFEKHQENIHFQHRQTTAATSSSSKVSNSHKYKADFQGTKASPVESVSSSPLRTSDKNPLDQHKRHSWAITKNVHSQELGKKGLAQSKRKYDFGSDSDQAKAGVSRCFNGDMDRHVVKVGDLAANDQGLKNAGLNNKDSVSGTENRQLNPVKKQKVNSVSLSLHDNKDSVSGTDNRQLNPVKKQKVNSVSLSLHDNCSYKQLTYENGKTPSHFNSYQSGHTNLISGEVRPDEGSIQYKGLKINPSTVKGSKQQQSLNNATCKAKQPEKAVIAKMETRKQITLSEGASDPTNASVLLNEAQDLKRLSNDLKKKGDDFESTSMCFEAVLKFLHVACLWEAPSTDTSKQVDPILTMKLFSETGNLCRFVAHEFEQLKKMGNAALAYKCVEVAYMKAAFFKHPGAIKDRHALQTTSLMPPQGESPSSSASDVDNLINQSTAVKTVRGVYSPHIASNLISRNNHHMMGLLAYVEDVNNAFEGTRKSQNSFSIYLSDVGKYQIEGVALLREVLDFSFHNVNGLVQLIRQSLVSINRESVK